MKHDLTSLKVVLKLAPAQPVKAQLTLLCPRCRQKMKVIAVINDGKVIDKILNHLDYRFEVLPLPPQASRPPPPFFWSAEDFDQP